MLALHPRSDLDRLEAETRRISNLFNSGEGMQIQNVLMGLIRLLRDIGERVERIESKREA